MTATTPAASELTLDALRREIAENSVYQAALELAVEAGGDDNAHDASHVLRVAHWTLKLGGSAVARQEAILAALLHDCVNVPKSSDDRSRASELCALRARDFLWEHDVDRGAVDRICQAILEHSYSRGATPQGPLSCALQDADRLEALGAIGILRTASTGARMRARYFHAEDPWGTDRDLDDRQFTLDHFFQKLLQLASTLQTEAGRSEARRRTELMWAFLEQLGSEIGQPLPPSRQPPSRQR